MLPIDCTQFFRCVIEMEYGGAFGDAEELGDFPRRLTFEVDPNPWTKSPDL